MSEAAQNLLTQALALPPEDQHWLSHRLQEECEQTGDEGEDIEGYAEWREELDRRLQSIADGTAVLVPFEESMQRIREKVAERVAS